VANSTLHRFFVRHAITRKKTGHAIEQDRPDVLKQRRAWFAGQLDLAPERLVFIDGSEAEAEGDKRGPPPTWLAATDALRGASACGWASRMATARPRRWSQDCARAG